MLGRAVFWRWHRQECLCYSMAKERKRDARQELVSFAAFMRGRRLKPTLPGFFAAREILVEHVVHLAGGAAFQVGVADDGRARVE